MIRIQVRLNSCGNLFRIPVSLHSRTKPPTCKICKQCVWGIFPSLSLDSVDSSGVSEVNTWIIWAATVPEKERWAPGCAPPAHLWHSLEFQLSRVLSRRVSWIQTFLTMWVTVLQDIDYPSPWGRALGSLSQVTWGPVGLLLQAMQIWSFSISFMMRTWSENTDLND